MQLILTQDVDNLGDAGELVNVKPGFGRNYLLPQGLALSATKRNIKRLEHDRAMIAQEVAKQRTENEWMAKRIGGMTLQFERLVGEGDKMFGSVTARDLSSQLAVAKIEVDSRRIQLPEAIKAVGKYEANVKLGAGVIAVLKFWVVGKDQD
ncbi:MAG: 50S ribosomal protein L9 [Myxococcales bacterium]|nr:50S ribosomal protein L9 [Myxococcales bacterium]